MGMNIIWNYGRGVHGSIGRNFHAIKKGGFFFTQLWDKKKFDVFARGKKRKNPLSVEKCFIFYMLMETMNNWNKVH